MNSILFFIIAIGVLVTVHEAGHFLVAKRLGVKVLRFSVGFGRPLWRRRAGPDDTEYQVAMVPLGGYVKMLDEREGEVDPGEAHRAFNNQTLGVRTAVVAAGPAANFLLAVAAYWLMFIVGVGGFRAVVDQVEPGGIAARAGLAGGDEIVAVDGTPTRSWDRVVQALTAAAVEDRDVSLRVSTGGASHVVDLEASAIDVDALSRRGFLEQLGVEPLRPAIEPVVGRIESGSPAAAAGLEVGDRLLRADGEEVGDWRDWVDYVRARPETPIRLVVERDGAEHRLDLVPGAVDDAGSTIGRIGAAVVAPDLQSHPMYVVERYGPLDAVARAGAKTWEISRLTLNMIWKMVTLQISAENLSGPISIAQYAGDSAKVGLARYLEFLALVSVSLGILNLLPIPLLDGGHLMYYLIELFKGKPVSEEAQLAGQRLGLAMLAGLMGLAFFNDFVRLLG